MSPMTMPALCAGFPARLRERWRRFFRCAARIDGEGRASARAAGRRRDSLAGCGLFKQGVDDQIDRGRGDGDGAEASKARRGDAYGAALSVNYGSADGGRLQANVEADVRGESGAGPGAALGRDEADDAECGYRAAGAGAADD